MQIAVLEGYTMPRRKKSACPFGKVKSGPRKGRCRKQRRRRSRR
jgi:hypothetical protein